MPIWSKEELEQIDRDVEWHLKWFDRFLVALLVISLLALGLTIAHAAPAPKPSIPTAITFTQGTVTRTLPISSASCTDYRGSPVNGQHGLTRFRLICGNVGQGSYVQFQTDAGPIYPQWQWPAPTCGQKPAVASQHATCPPGTEGATPRTLLSSSTSSAAASSSAVPRRIS